MPEARVYPYNEGTSRFSVGLEGDWLMLRSEAEGGSSRWKALGLDEVIDLARFLVSCADQMPRRSGAGTLYCSFCGKSQHEVTKLIAGPRVFICDQCTDLCAGIVAANRPAGGEGGGDGT